MSAIITQKHFDTQKSSCDWQEHRSHGHRSFRREHIVRFRLFLGTGYLTVNQHCERQPDQQQKHCIVDDNTLHSFPERLSGKRKTESDMAVHDVNTSTTTFSFVIGHTKNVWRLPSSTKWSISTRIVGHTKTYGKIPYMPEADSHRSPTDPQTYRFPNVSDPLRVYRFDIRKDVVDHAMFAGTIYLTSKHNERVG